jgi:hypothetical protein
MHTLRPLLAAALIVASASCSGSGSPTQPGPAPQPIQISGISPVIGATNGGTPVTITGSGFAAGTTVTIGGIAATNVAVNNGTTITAVAGPRTSGTGDVVVSLQGRQAVLSNAFTYMVPSSGPNAPPAVEELRAQGNRRNQPPAMADLGETLVVSVNVSDAETAGDALIYEWTATAGTFSGSGTSVTWRAPETLPSTPVSVTLTLTVIERYVEFDSRNVPIGREHRIATSREVRVHNSIEEVRSKARGFLLAFSDSSVPTATVMKDFTASCPGTEAENFDVARNRCTFIITASSVGNASPTVDFGGTCPFRGRRADACSVLEVRWESTVRDDANSCPLNEVTLTPGAREIAEGVDQVSAVYVGGEWRLCDSDFIGSSRPASIFKRK